MRYTITIMAALGACGPGGDPIYPDTTTSDGPTWNADVAPIVYAHCVKCHTTGGAAPFALDDYLSASAWSGQSLKKLMGDSAPPYIMPPWNAVDTDECSPPAPWVADERLSDQELATFANWVAAGSPEGDPATAAPLPDTTPVVLPNTVPLKAATPMSISAADQDDMYRCTPLDPGLTEPGWITGVQVNPGDTSVVHHVVIFTDPTGASPSMVGADGSYPCFGGAGVPDEGVIFAWAPGSDPLQVPADAGVQMPAGGQLVMQVHYHPQGLPATDDTTLNVQWATQQPAQEAEMLIYGIVSEDEANSASIDDPPFLVPAGEAAHTETLRYPLEVPASADIRLWSVFSHMHLAGTDIKVSLNRGADNICLAQNPAWDFNWQRTYVYDGSFDELPQVLDGDELEIRCTFNNTMDNPIVADELAIEGLSAPVDFHAGENTTDEMCVAIVGIVY